jgi:galactonate dehydratase
MKITAIRPIVADGGHRIIVFVKVETDQPGLIGWGEATLEGKPRALLGCIADMEPQLLGQDPRRIEHCWQLLYRGAFWRMGVIGLSVISAIDQALWDIKGKDLGVPVYELLGGRVRDKVRMYTHFGGATPEALAANARAKVERGWTAIKTVPVPITNMVDGPRKLRQAEEGLRAVREAVGEDVDILLDLHGRLTPQMAIQYGKRFEQYAPFFLEEPVPAENPAAMAPVARALSTPIATGERLFLRWGFRELLDAGAASVLQPDPCHAGGISEVRRIAAMAEVHYAAVAPHNPYGPVATAVAVHLDLACPNFLIQEMVDPLETPEAQSLVRDPLQVVDGHILPPTKPGLGIEVDEAECARRVPDYSFEKAGGMATRYYTAFHEDGSVADS